MKQHKIMFSLIWYLFFILIFNLCMYIIYIKKYIKINIEGFSNLCNLLVLKNILCSFIKRGI
jgi:hypothetical protein